MEKMLLKIVKSMFLFIIIGVIASCGTSESIEDSIGAASALKTGQVELKIKWPDEDSQSENLEKILNNAGSVKVTVTGALISTPITAGVSRVPGSIQEMLTISDIPVGNNVFTFDVYNIADWNSATVDNLIQQTISSHTVVTGNSSFTINLTDDICFNIILTPLNESTGVGSGVVFTATAQNADNEVIIGEVFAWQSGSPSVASVNSIGDNTASVSALVRGTSVITASCDNKSVQTNFNVILANPNLQGVNPGNGEIALTWTSVADATGYKIYYGTEPGVYPNALTIGNVITSTVTGLTNGSTYYLAVSATLGAEESPVSNELFTSPAIAVGSVSITIQ